MATEEQKKARQLKAFNTIIFGMTKGLYDMLGDSMRSVATPIGEDIIEEMEHEMGLEIHGEDPQAILTELERLLVDEYGLLKSASLKINDKTHEVDILCEGCLLWHTTAELKAAGIPQLACVPMMIAEAALTKRLGKHAKFIGITQDIEKRACDIDLHMIDLD